MNPSFRFFAKAIHDLGVIRLSDRALKGWIFLRCAEVFYDGCFPSDVDLAWYCRIKGRKFKAIVDELIAGGRLECDHVHPLSKGGSNEIGNLTTACFRCNRSKNTKTLAEWAPEGRA